MPPQQHHERDFGKSVSQFLGLCQCWAMMGQLWLRIPGTAGKRAWGIRFFVGYVMFLVIAAFSESPWMLDAWVYTGGLFVINKAVGMLLPPCHSLYVGDSVFSLIASNEIAVRFLEPAFVFAIGLWLIDQQFQFGGLVIWLAISMFLVGCYHAAAERAIRTARDDAMFE